MRRSRKLAILVGAPLVVFGVMAAGLFIEGDTETARGTVAAGVIAASVCGGSMIYDIEAWSLLRRSVVHFAVMVVTVLPALLLSGWFSLETPGGYIAVVGLFFAIGAVAWAVMFGVSQVASRRGHEKP